MFEESLFQSSLVESTGLLRSRNRWPALLSFATQAALAVIIIAVPMLYPELLPVHAPTLSLTPPPAPRAPQPPPPVQHVHAELAATSAPSAPSAPPAAQSLIHSLLRATPVTDEPTIPATLGTGMASNNASALGIDGSHGNAPNVTAISAKPSAPAVALRVSSGIIAGLLLAPITPTYPAIARAAGVQGTVVIHALISRTGSIEQAQVVSGSPMLQNAALEAVKTARYRPYLLNGQPTEVDTTITVNFRMSS